MKKILHITREQQEALLELQVEASSFSEALAILTGADNSHLLEPLKTYSLEELAYLMAGFYQTNDVRVNDWYVNRKEKEYVKVRSLAKNLVRFCYPSDVLIHSWSIESFLSSFEPVKDEFALAMLELGRKSITPQIGDVYIDETGSCEITDPLDVQLALAQFQQKTIKKYFLHETAASF